MNIIKKYTSRSLWLAGLMITALMAGCLSSGGSNNNDDVTEVNAVPTVLETVPADSATGVTLNSTTVIASFSEAMDSTTINNMSFTLAENGTEVDGTIEYFAESKTASFDAGSVEFIADTVYTARITTMVEDSTGLPLAADYVWTFTTGSAAETDTTSPTVVSTNPADAEVDFSLNRNVSANFSEALDPASVNSSNFTVSQSGTDVSGEVTYSNKLATFYPTNDLLASTVYTASLNGSITDLAGNALAAETWTFTTGDITAVAAGPAPINLRTAGNFVILTKTGITNVPTSDITGNIGASPITSAEIGVTCSELTGLIYGVDAGYTGTCFNGSSDDKTLVDNAVLDMGTAYTDAAGRTNPDFTELHAGDLSGKTLVPGLYKWSTGINIYTDVTLNGGADDVWIFQIAQDITQASDTKVLLAGGAVAKNVFWQVAGGTGVAIDTGATFEGIVLAEKGITVKTGARINGRLLSQTAVTLQKNIVTQPAE